MPDLSFHVKCSETQWGEQVAVVGSWNAWDTYDLSILSTGPDRFPIWSASVSVSEEILTSPIHYKYAIIRDGSIVRWEVDGTKFNRIIDGSESNDDQRVDNFGNISAEKIKTNSPNSTQFVQVESMQTSRMVSLPKGQSIDRLEAALQRITNERKSWRQRLAFVRSLFVEQEVALDAGFDRFSLDHLVSLSVYLSFLASGQIRCEEDGGHYRPNHHANEARVIEAALAAISHETSLLEYNTSDSFLPYVIRRIYPHLPSYSSQFTVSVPLTRIRDIAHRSDIPHDLKQEIKHTLQNKLHRCAGPEDLKTSERFLERISYGGYSPDFVHQFQIFHAELREFFNASSVDDRMNYLMNEPSTRPVADLASAFAKLKHSWSPAFDQAQKLTELREKISLLPLLQVKSSGDSDDLPSEHTQKTRLADVELENYLFPLLADSAKDLECEQSVSDFPWVFGLKSLGLALKNVQLSGICPKETDAITNELFAVSNRLKNQKNTLNDDLVQRMKASVDRAVRFSHEFAASISDVYSRRAATLGRTLGVDDHSISVFAEAEIRSNIMFQASRISDSCSKLCRKALHLPPWDTLFAGEAEGKIVFFENLSEIPEESSNPLIAVCRHATGDEDIPLRVQGVILGRSLPHLSHLGVRARQAKVVFVCAEEQQSFETIWAKRHLDYVSLKVNSAIGLESLSNITKKDSENGEEHEKNKQTRKISDDTFSFSSKGTSPVPLTQATIEHTSSKCTFAGKLASLASSSSGLFEAPDGLAIPHGMFQTQIADNTEYYELVRKFNNASETELRDKAAQAIREFIKIRFEVTARTCKRIQSSFKKEARVMVRSSANAEDLEEMSGAGLYDSIANVDVHDTDSLEEAILDVWASLWTKRAASSRASFSVAHEKVSMAVLVQEMVPSNLSFVGFSIDPVSQDDKYCYVEIAVGMGETLASANGNGTPYRFKVSRNTNEIDTLSYASYSRALIANSSEKCGLLEQVIDYSKELMTTDVKFREGIVQRIGKAILFLENEFGGPQDVEGAITIENGKATLCVVQARPQIL